MSALRLSLSTRSRGVPVRGTIRKSRNCAHRPISSGQVSRATRIGPSTSQGSSPISPRSLSNAIVYSIADVLPLPMPAQIAQRLCSRAKSTIGFWMGRRTRGLIVVLFHQFIFDNIWPESLHVIVHLCLRPDHEGMAIEFLTSRVVAFLPFAKFAADRLRLDEVDAREAESRPRHDAIRNSRFAGRLEVLAHAAVQLDLLKQVSLHAALAKLFGCAALHLFHAISGTCNW